jgi:hypothetical protein
MLVSGGEHERVWEPQRVVLGAKFCGPLRDRGGERDNRDSHAGDRLARILETLGSRECDENFAVGAGGGQEPAVGSVGLIDLVDGTIVVAVLGVEQSDQDAGVED